VKNLYFDTETFSECDLKTAGTHVYSRHPSTDIQLFSYGLEEGEVKVWDRTKNKKMPKDLALYFENPEILFWAHNVWFDRNLIEGVLGSYLPLNRYRCSMAKALAHGLPAGLGDLGAALGIRDDYQKIKDGRRLVLKFCKKDKNGNINDPADHPEDWAKYVEYCRIDTISMREIIKKTPNWNYPRQQVELDYWLMDQEINSRGMPIDLELANAAMEAIAIAQTDLAAKTKKMTNGEVNTAGQRDEMIKHIAKIYGYYLPNMQKGTIGRMVDDPQTPEPLRELLEVRLSTATTATAKYKPLAAMTSLDGRLRGTIQYAGASRTLRDSGRGGYQCQNLARPTMEHDDILGGIDSLKNGTAAMVGFDIMKLSSSALRYAICAPEGKKFVISDLSNIEGRALAYLAGETWKVKAFADFDAGIGHDLYKVAYAKAFGVDPADVTKEQRNAVGKVLELSMGYAGGVGALLVFLNSFGVDLEELAETVTPLVPPKILAEADSFYEWMVGMEVTEAKKKALDQMVDWETIYEAKRTHKLPKHVHMALESLKRLWRKEHPETVGFWADAEAAVRSAIFSPKEDFSFGNGCSARKTGNWVRITLPSGHVLPYPGMKVNKDGKLSFLGINQFTKKWGQIQTTGGKLVENATQAFSRDIFKHGQLLAMQEGYKVVMPLHDELVCEVPDTEDYTHQRLEELMATVPSWAPGFPLAAAGFTAYRYRK